MVHGLLLYDKIRDSYLITYFISFWDEYSQLFVLFIDYISVNHYAYKLVPDLPYSFTRYLSRTPSYSSVVLNFGPLSSYRSGSLSLETPIQYVSECL